MGFGITIKGFSSSKLISRFSLEAASFPASKAVETLLRGHKKRIFSAENSTKTYPDLMGNVSLCPYIV